MKSWKNGLPVRRALRSIALVLLATGTGAAPAQAPPAADVTALNDSVTFRGRIDAASTAEFLRLLQDPKITRLVITSGGGSVTAALDMAEAIHSRGLDVEVPRACLSSCANYIFPAARHKTIGRPDAVGWHGNIAHALYRQQAGQLELNERQIAGARQLAAREADFFSRIGVDGFVCWFGKLAPYDVEDFYSLSAEDMALFGIHDVTVSQPAPNVPANPEVREIHVDGDALERMRRFVQPSVRPPA